MVSINIFTEILLCRKYLIQETMYVAFSFEKKFFDFCILVYQGKF